MTNLITKTDSETISLLRMPMAFLVVLWHAAGFGISDGHSMSYSNGLFDIVKISFSEGLCIISVPIFFVISGYLFEAHFTQWNLSEYKNYIKRKLPKLIIPYFLWNIICFCVLYISAISTEFVKDGYVSTCILDYFRTKNGIQIFAYGSSGYPIDYPLWFIRDLIFVYIFYPLLSLLNRMGGGIVLIVNLLNIVGPLMGLPRYIPLTAISFFLTGMYLKRNKKSIDILLDTNNTWYLLLAFSSIILFFMVFYYSKAVVAYDVISRLFIYVLSPVVIHLVFLYAEKRNGKIKILNDVVPESFFIFAVHAIFLGYLSLGINFIFATKCNVLMILLYFFTAAITYAISILTYKIFKKAFPKTTSILTGGR